MGCGSSAPAEPLDYATTTKNWHHVAGLKKGPCGHVPTGAEPAKNVEENGPCDCFYVHGTSDFQAVLSNASSIGDGYAQHVNMLRREATWANGCCKMFAPGYRQFTVKTIVKLVMGFECKKEVELAQSDIDAAFTAFLDKYCTGDRPFILAGHSQGGMMIRHLIRTRIDHDPALRARLVCAYVAGAQVGSDSFVNVPIAAGETDTGCVVTWATTSEKNAARKNEGAPAKAAGVEWTKAPVSVNLLTWSTTDDSHGSKEQHHGCLDMNATAVHADMRVSARTCNKGAAPGKGGILLVGEHDQVPQGYVNEISESWDYHEGDIPCFWQNLRANAIKRLEAWTQQRPV